MFIIEDWDNLFFFIVFIVDIILVMQFGVLVIYVGDNLQVLYYYFYSLVVFFFFIIVCVNVKLFFEKVYIFCIDFKFVFLIFFVLFNDVCLKIFELVCYGMFSRYIFVNLFVLGECKFEVLRILFLIKFENFKFYMFMVICRINIIIFSF